MMSLPRTCRHALTAAAVVLIGTAALLPARAADSGAAGGSPTTKPSQTDRAAAMRKAQAAALAKQKALEGKPLTIAGTTVDGKPFASDAYKGKVVLVDFWATWCPPCRAELPRVKEVYAKYHDQGLEMVGVSNDYTADALTTYTAKNAMPWVELLDAPAAAAHKWNPVTLDQGIRGIPTMFLIDKQGVCRTVSARENMEQVIPKLLAE